MTILIDGWAKENWADIKEAGNTSYADLICFILSEKSKSLVKKHVLFYQEPENLTNIDRLREKISHKTKWKFKRQQVVVFFIRQNCQKRRSDPTKDEPVKISNLKPC